jgi:ATP-dependent DNA helicase PIF1
MLSKKMFESLNEVCKLKDPELFFGGIQLILSGDFTQLPPVPNQMYGEEGDFCFTSELFENILPHRVKLTEVIRQTEKELIKAIQEIANGIVSIETEVFMKGLTRPLPCDTDSIKLFARNEQVDVYNRNRIIDFPGQLYEFRSADEGHQKHLNKILAPKTLWLKIGAPVILLRNLSNKLVNGLRGNIHDISETGPVVEFPSLNV